MAIDKRALVEAVFAGAGDRGDESAAAERLVL